MNQLHVVFYSHQVGVNDRDSKMVPLRLFDGFIYSESKRTETKPNKMGNV